MSAGMHYVLEASNVVLRESKIAFPDIIGKPAGDMVKAIMPVWSLNVYLHAAARMHRVNNLCVVIQRYEWIHHRMVPPRRKPADRPVISKQTITTIGSMHRSMFPFKLIDQRNFAAQLTYIIRAETRLVNDQQILSDHFKALL
jgi:hypothetical protein